MICKLCKQKEGVNNINKLNICDSCLLDIQLAFTYHINGKEVTRTEYKELIK